MLQKCRREMRLIGSPENVVAVRISQTCELPLAALSDDQPGADDLKRDRERPGVHFKHAHLDEREINALSVKTDAVLAPHADPIRMLVAFQRQEVFQPPVYIEKV